MNITLFDTSAATDNLGDEIIMNAIEKVVRQLFPDAYIYKVATHEYMSRVSRRILARSELSFVCGTNLLSSNMSFRGIQWKLNPWDVSVLDHAILCGVGWRDYDKKPNAYTRWLLGRVLKHNQVHSVRDRYTKERLSNIGVDVVNTSCPTLWELTPEHCAVIPQKKTDSVLTTLNWYRPSQEIDADFLKALTRNYKKVYFWPQTSQDIGYFEGLGVSGIKRISPSMTTYNTFLENEDVDFIGHRLHGGIRALQKLKRSLITAVDNRATEISRDTGLPIIDRPDLAGMEKWIWSEAPTTLALPTEAISQWKQQFA
jgi:polysaccharide pyruvyl transferase WcaK-like protein